MTKKKKLSRKTQMLIDDVSQKACVYQIKIDFKNYTLLERSNAWILLCEAKDRLEQHILRIINRQAAK